MKSLEISEFEVIFIILLMEAFENGFKILYTYMLFNPSCYFFHLQN